MVTSNCKPKVLFLIPTFSSGGIEQYLLRFLKEKQMLLQVTIISRNNFQGELFHAYQNLGVELIFMPLGYLNFIRLFQFYRLLRREKFDVVCDFNGNFAGLTMLISRFSRVETRLTWYRQARDHFSRNIFKTLYNKFINRLVLRFSTKILFNSYTAVNFFFPREKKHKKFRVIYNGIKAETLEPTLSRKDIRECLNIPLDKYVIGHVGRLDGVKNHQTIIKVAKFLSEKDDKFHFVFCGRNIPDLNSQIKKDGIDSLFTLIGYRTDINNVLNAFDLFYFPSVTEGQPNALLEAIIFGLPFVASDIDAIKECVPKAAYERLVAPYDYVGAAQLIQEIKHQKKINTYRNWAKEIYHSERRFSEFLQELL